MAGPSEWRWLTLPERNRFERIMDSVKAVLPLLATHAKSAGMRIELKLAGELGRDRS